MSDVGVGSTNVTTPLRKQTQRSPWFQRRKKIPGLTEDDLEFETTYLPGEKTDVEGTPLSAHSDLRGTYVTQPQRQDGGIDPHDLGERVSRK